MHRKGHKKPPQGGKAAGNSSRDGAFHLHRCGGLEVRSPDLVAGSDVTGVRTPEPEMMPPDEMSPEVTSL